MDHSYRGIDINFPSPMIHSNKLTNIDILKTLKQLKHSTHGADNIPGFLLKDCTTSFTPLHYIFNLILKISFFPTIWKVVNICPI